MYQNFYVLSCYVLQQFVFVILYRKKFAEFCELLTAARAIVSHIVFLMFLD